MELILLKDKNILLVKEGDVYRFPLEGEVDFRPLGEIFHYEEALSAAVEEMAMKGEVEAEWVGLRESFSLAGEDIYRRVGKAAELHFWDAQSRFCPVCGAKLRREAEIMKGCPDCGREYFPQVSPAIIVLVRKGEEALLVHAKNFSRPFFGLVAGFVETGESLEECVRREVREETGLEIGNIRYFGSQSWPFPAQLMVGFTADYVSGEIRFADGELSAGSFFTRASCPQIPTYPSIARSLIDSWLAER